MREIEIFNNYYKQFDSSIKDIEEKYKHTFRVLNYAKIIAKSINLNDDDIKLASICALFHDIGRFSQFTEYKTYDDSISIDHGNRGEEVLKSLNYLDPIVLTSVKYHNKYKLPDNIDERTKIFATITRDADKLDIMITQANVVKAKECIIPDEIFQDIKNHKLIDNDLKTSDEIITAILREIAFIFDMNYKKSFEIIKNSNLINYKCNIIYNNIKDPRIIEIKNICNKYIDDKLNEII